MKKEIKILIITGSISLIVSGVIFFLYNIKKKTLFKKKNKEKNKQKRNKENNFLYLASSAGNKKSYKFHKIICRIAKAINKKHIIYFKSREEAIKKGFQPCKICKP